MITIGDLPARPLPGPNISGGGLDLVKYFRYDRADLCNIISCIYIIYGVIQFITK